MGPNVPLDTIIKKMTIVYGNVKSFDLLMWDFYCTDQVEDDSIPSFATQIERQEQRFLRDCLLYGCKKSIQDSVKFCFTDPHLDYMHFLEECRKAEEEEKVGQAKAGTKATVAAATVPPTKEDELLNNTNISSIE